MLVGEEALMKRLRAMERENQKLKERLEEVSHWQHLYNIAVLLLTAGPAQE